jgi:hypothetical protein
MSGQGSNAMIISSTVFWQVELDSIEQGFKLRFAACHAPQLKPKISSGVLVATDDHTPA